jgi:hypothetical protein
MLEIKGSAQKSRRWTKGGSLSESDGSATLLPGKNPSSLYGFSSRKT